MYYILTVAILDHFQQFRYQFSGFVFVEFFLVLIEFSSTQLHNDAESSWLIIIVNYFWNILMVEFFQYLHLLHPINHRFLSHNFNCILIPAHFMSATMHVRKTAWTEYFPDQVILAQFSVDWRLLFLLFDWVGEELILHLLVCGVCLIVTFFFLFNFALLADLGTVSNFLKDLYLLRQLTRIYLRFEFLTLLIIFGGSETFRQLRQQNLRLCVRRFIFGIKLNNFLFLRIFLVQFPLQDILVLCWHWGSAFGEFHRLNNQRIDWWFSPFFHAYRVIGLKR
jgi:hypothetical protein